MSGTTLLTFLLVFSTPLAQQSAISAENFLWVNKDFCTAGQPTIEDLDQLKAGGLNGVLNLRRPSESPFQVEEEKHARAIGLRYFNIPVDSSHLEDVQVEEFLQILGEETNRPLLVHCGSANRVGAFWMIHRVLKDRWSLEKAEEEARQIGLSSSVLLEFARRYIRNH